MDRIAYIAAKLTHPVLKKLKRGTSLPGLLAQTISPKLIERIVYPKIIIGVTGTNGKTSTSHLLADIFRAAGLTVVHNYQGANMDRGILTTILEETNWNYQLKADALVMEIDEGHVPKMLKSIQPTIFVITNFFHDQSERYGDLSGLISRVQSAIKPNTTLVLNGNDPLVRKIGFDLKENPKVYFGVDSTEDSIHSEADVKDAKWCPNCNQLLDYEFYHYSHIGKYNCSCGLSTPEMNYEAKNVDLKNKSFTVNDEDYQFGYNNLYFLFNVVGAIAAASEAGIDHQYIKKAVAAFQIGEGRMEKFMVGNYTTFLNLVKNPAGLNQSISHILNQGDNQFCIFLSLNNTPADSIDTAWVWDVAFEKLHCTGLEAFICSGVRAYDLAVRLQYAGITEEKIIVMEDIRDGLNYLRNKTHSKPYVLSNYTPLGTVRELLQSFPENKNIERM